MIVRPVEECDLPLIQQWLSEPDNIKWLDFTEMSLLKLKFMLGRPTDVYRVFCPSRSQPPIGIVAIVNIHPVHRNGVIWVVLGDKRFSGQGYTTQASSEILEYAYSKLKLSCISSYVVETNRNPLVKSFGFVYYGRQRQCHFVDGALQDRLWYDLLSSEFKPLHFKEVEVYNEDKVETASTR
jgi:RimJ/RimL family protein N-acetyltransferase